jgi:hypothetical protein
MTCRTLKEPFKRLHDLFPSDRSAEHPRREAQQLATAKAKGGDDEQYKKYKQHIFPRTLAEQPGQECPQGLGTI